MFEGFDDLTIDTGEATIRARRGGEGRPVLLLHGIPETHVMWHKVAPRLAEEFTVVAADLRGDTETAASRLVGPATPARCAYRTALDHPARVDKLGVLDIVPTSDAFDHANMQFGLAYWVWFFLAQPYDVPERIIGANPQLFLDYMLDGWSVVRDAFPRDVRDEYARTFANPATVHAICEEYRGTM